jgi:hypothetical protein
MTFYICTYKNQIFFGSQATPFSRDPSCQSTGAYVPFWQGSHMWKQYHQKTTLCTWEHWRTQERDAEYLAPTIARIIHSASEPLGMTFAQRYDVPWDWLWDACHMAGIRWGFCCKGFCSKEGPHYRFEQSARKLAINLIQEFGNPLGIPYPSCTAKLSGAYVTQESVSSRILVSKKGMICVCLTDVRARNLRQKTKSILLWETNTFCAWNMGAHVQCSTS